MQDRWPIWRPSFCAVFLMRSFAPIEKIIDIKDDHINHPKCQQVIGEHVDPMDPPMQSDELKNQRPRTGHIRTQQRGKIDEGARQCDAVFQICAE